MTDSHASVGYGLKNGSVVTYILCIGYFQLIIYIKALSKNNTNYTIPLLVSQLGKTSHSTPLHYISSNESVTLELILSM